jgi:NTE family protein
MIKVGLAFGGGGARGLCFIEFCKALDDLNIKPSIISGTSIGAIMGAFYAAGYAGYEMERFLRNITLLKIPRLVDLKLFGRTSVLKGRRLEIFIKHLLDCDTFSDLDIPLKITATDYWKRKPVVFDEGPLIPAIRASMSLPAVFEPVYFDGRVLIDGGSTNPLPIDIIRDECDYLIAIDVSGELYSKDDQQIPGMYDSIMSAYQIMQNTIIAERLKFIKPDLYIKPRLANFGLLDFHREKEIRKSVRADVYRFKRILKNDLLKRKAA